MSLSKIDAFGIGDALCGSNTFDSYVLKKYISFNKIVYSIKRHQMV